MKKIGKKFVEVNKLVDKNKFYILEEVMELVKKIFYIKFDVLVDLVFRLNFDIRKVDQ